MIKFNGKKICLLTESHLCLNPRLWKEAFLFEKEGYEVIIISLWTKSEYLLKDKSLLCGHNIQYKAFLNLIKNESNFFKRLFYRIRRRIVTELVRIGIELPLSLSYAPNLMFKTALIENADLYIIHTESALYAGLKLIKKSKKVSFDFEDWYSRDYLIKTRPIRLLKNYERKALHFSKYCTAPSYSMAKALSVEYSSSLPTVIYNVFPGNQKNCCSIPTKYLQAATPKILWFSRTIGPGRGIETAIEAINSIEFSIELHLLGIISENYRDQLIKLFNAGTNDHKLIFHDFIPHEHLHDFIQGFTIGLALEQKEPASRDLTVTNKIFQYLQAGIMVLATATRGQLEIAEKLPEFVKIVEFNNAQQWALAMVEMILSEKRNNINQKDIYNSKFSWEIQEQKYRKLLEDSLN